MPSIIIMQCLHHWWVWEAQTPMLLKILSLSFMVVMVDYGYCSFLGMDEHVLPWLIMDELFGNFEYSLFMSYCYDY